MTSSLKKAVAAIQDSVEVLCNRTDNEEVKVLQAVNAHLEQEISIIDDDDDDEMK